MTELTWEGKYKDGRKTAPVRIALPFQTIETVDESVQKRWELFAGTQEPEWRNRLIWGDKKYVLPSLLPELAGKVNLIYIDPPFDTGANFSFTAQIPQDPNEAENPSLSFTKEPSLIEQKAYRDTWGKGLDSYLQWFYETAILLRELLAEDGSIYVHLDWRLVHYAKAILDEIFGYDNFLNEIIWQSAVGDTSAKNKKFIKSHDTILSYTKSQVWLWNDVLQDYSEASLKLYSQSDVKGSYTLVPVDNPGGGGYSYNLGYGEKIPTNGYRMPESTALMWLKEGSLVVEKGKVPRRKQYISKGVRCKDISVEIAGSVAKLYPTQKPEALLERIIKASSNPGDLVLDCFCGSGTTAATAEKLDRRWITCDLGRFAIHTARKRLMGIKDHKPFVVQNLGKYERQEWMKAEFGDEAVEGAAVREQNYRKFILDLYGGQPLQGYAWLHGTKAGHLVHVGGVDAPVSYGDVQSLVKEFWRTQLPAGEIKGGRVAGIDVLGWDFAFDINETAREFAEAHQIKLRLLKIPREILEPKAVQQGDIRFFELAYLEAKTTVKNLTATLTLSNFIVPPDDVPAEIRNQITHWSQWIDYWAIDWNYLDDTFHNMWQSYRTRQKTKLELSTSHHYDKPGRYRVVVKVIDILGNDTTKAFTLEIQ